jgi:enoyl-CoA hydratase
VAEALALAEKICANAPLSVRASKEIMRRSVGMSEEEAWEMNAELITPIFTSKDAMEGSTAFAEKRPPVWQGA